MFELIKSLNVFIGEQHVGRLAISPDRLCVFEYTPQFIARGFSLSPFYLPLRPGLQVARSEPFGGLFGVFNDSLPDGWGQLLIDRYLVSQGIQPEALSILDRLSLVGSAGMGALEYRPDNHLTSSQTTNDLNYLAGEIKKVLFEEHYSENLKLLAEKGGSSGGARPKVLIDIEGKPWIVKFSSAGDPSNSGEIEYEYSLTAKQCGIEMPQTALLERQYFGIRRFDRDGDKRIHMHSASGLLYASHRFPSLDYADLIKSTYALTKNVSEAYKVFRLMLFNVLTGNKDDHAKNFSFLYDGGQWRFAPAYDLVPSDGFNGNHSTTISGRGQPNKADIIGIADKCGLDHKMVHQIFDEVYDGCEAIRVKQL